MLTVENLVAFEEEVRSGSPEDTVAVWTGGSPSGLERACMTRLIAGGIQRVDHWGDLDVGGLRIFRHLTEILPCLVSPWRMEPDLLSRLPTQPLTDRDREALVAWRGDPDAPLQEQAAALLGAGVKAEQEGRSSGSTPPARVPERRARVSRRRSLGPSGHPCSR